MTYLVRSCDGVVTGLVSGFSWLGRVLGWRVVAIEVVLAIFPARLVAAVTDQPADVPSANELREFLTGQPVEPRPPIIEVPVPRSCDS